jgi:hypothetical protein
LKIFSKHTARFSRELEYAFFALGKAFIFLLFGVMAIGGSLSAYRAELLAPHLVGIEATVESVSWSSGRENWIPKVFYSYEYEGNLHSSNQVFLTSSIFKNKGEWLKFTEEIDQVRLKKAKIQAWVDPKNPTRAVLFREVNLLDKLGFLGIGIAFCLVGILAFRLDYAESIRKQGP